MVLLLLLCLTPLYLRAGDSITIDMKVLDGQTRKELQGVRVTSMTLDSTIIHAAFSGYEEYGETMIMPFGPTRFVKYACKVKVPGPGEYLLRYDLTGYSTLYKKVKIPTRELGQRVRTWSLGNVYLLPLAVELGDSAKLYRIMELFKEAGILSDWFLYCDTAFRISPPLTISEEEVRESAALISECLDRL